MRYMRRFICAGFAMAVMAVCASMPAAADVPLEVTLAAQPVIDLNYADPALAIVPKMTRSCAMRPRTSRAP